MDAIRNKSLESIFREYQRISYLSAREKRSVLWEASTVEMARNFVLDVEFVVEKDLTSKIFDLALLVLSKQEYDSLIQ